ncbi:hypothetical protein BJ508DRAFT_332339 [Ascobolus immersus RN42]|uniref:Uncharacterized protein n=1 Tax=Ascobolus immersus RN42 TaxID=1160509 RepID=A0A3N4HRV2_ASCIM|nr:hypothetical protein BJ508DRAFT_332339 [Ascobolus immersus RN42]
MSSSTDRPVSTNRTESTTEIGSSTDNLTWDEPADATTVTGEPISIARLVGKPYRFNTETLRDHITNRTEHVPLSAMQNVLRAMRFPHLDDDQYSLAEGSRALITTLSYDPVRYMNPAVWKAEDFKKPNGTVSFPLFGCRVYLSLGHKSGARSKQSIRFTAADSDHILRPLKPDATSVYACEDLIHHKGRVEALLAVNQTRPANIKFHDMVRIPMLGEGFTLNRMMDIFFEKILFIIADSDGFIIGQVNCEKWVQTELDLLVDTGHTVHGCVSNSGFRSLLSGRIYFDVHFGTEKCDTMLKMDTAESMQTILNERSNRNF